jgi:prepilin-type N-terminal cleavage/methylation domain-containing protein
MQKSTEGFTLVELLIVISIFSILVGFSVLFLKNYKEKAMITQDGIQIARNCIADLMSYCIDHPNGSIEPTKSLYCHNTTGHIFGEITYTIEAPINTCNGSELPEGYTVKVFSSAVQHYHIECKYVNKSVICRPEQH